MRRFSHLYKQGFDWAFRSGITHLLMHIFLYAVLAWLISLLFLNKEKKKYPIKVILIILCVSILQETIQLVSIKCPVGLDDVFDIMVDLIGGSIGIFVFRWRKRRYLTSNITKDLKLHNNQP
jgi:VanZ family protein